METKELIDYGGKRLSQAAIEKQRAGSAAAKRRRRAAGERIDYDQCECGREKMHHSSLCHECFAKAKRAPADARGYQIERWWAEGLKLREIADRLGWTVGALGGEMDDLRKRGFDLPYRQRVGVR